MSVDIKIREVEVGELHLPDYQRTDADRKNRLAKMRKLGWRPELAQVLDVVQDKNGVLFVVDGGTRMAFARECDITTLPARVISGLSYSKENLVFEGLNTQRTNPSVEVLYRAARMRKDSRVREIDRAVESAGGIVEFPKDGTPSPFGVLCLNTLLKLHDQYGSEVIEKTISSLITAFPDGKSRTRSALSKYVVEAVAFYIADNPKFNEQKLVSGLSQLDEPSERLRQDADGFRQKQNRKHLDAGLPLLNYPSRDHWMKAVAKAYTRGRAA